MQEDARHLWRERRDAGLAARKAGRREAALALFREASGFDPADPWCRNDIGHELLALGSNEEAEAVFQALRASDPSFMPALRGLALAARARGDRAAALAGFREASTKDPRDLWNRQDIATELLALGRMDEAEAAFHAVAAETPLAHALRGLGTLALRRGQLDEALDRFKAAALLAPQDPWFALDVAMTARKLGRLDEAARQAERLVAAHPFFAPGLFEQAEILARLGRREEARSPLVRLLARNPNHPEAYRILARLAESEGDAETAMRHLRAAVRLRPGDAALRLDLHALLRRTQGPEAARPLLFEAREADPHHPRVLLALGDAERERGAFDAAEGFYDAALAAAPNFYWVLTGKAALSASRGDAAAARALLVEAIAADPLEGFAQLELAALLRDGGDAQGAQDALAAIPETSPRAAQGAMAKGFIHRIAGDWHAAAGAFAEAARRFPAHVEALVEGAEDLFRAGSAIESATMLEEAAAKAPKHPAVLDALARRALLRDDLGLAEDLYGQAAKADPSRLWPPLALARLDAMRGRFGEAEAKFAAARRTFGPRPDIALGQADTLRQTGDMFGALALLQAARADFAHHSGLRFAEIALLIDRGALMEAEARLADIPSAGGPDEGRRQFMRSLLEAARWNFTAAIAAGEAAVAALPGDGWVRNRLIHAALLDLDLDRAGRHLRALAALEASASALRGKSANPSQSHYGQLYDEFRLDAELVEALVASRSLPSEAQTTALARLVRDNPDSTIAALQFLIAERRAGRLSVHKAETDAAAIPRIIHQYWDEAEPPPDVARYMASWQDMNPGMTHRLWSEADARAFLAARASPEVLPAFDRAREPAMKADLFRLALLATEGGIYADADDRCVAAIEPLLADGLALLAYQEDLGSLGNNFLAVAPAHPVIRRALTLATRAVNRGDTDILWLSTGPGLLSRAAAMVLCEDERIHDGMRVLDRHELSRFVAIHCLAGYKTSERHWSRTAFGRGRPPSQATRARSA